MTTREGDMLRQPAVANRFYPGSPRQLEQTLSTLLPPKTSNLHKAIGVVSPHAGYIYSGELAGRTLGSVEIPERVVILGPNHHGRGKPVAVSTTSWDMPAGVVQADREASETLAALSDHVEADEAAHQFEHSLEVQVPFLHALQSRLKLVPIAVSHVSYQVCVEVAQSIATVLTDAVGESLIVASTDMSHYESRQIASEKDDLALQRVLSLDPEGLYNTVLREQISMCGFIPVTIMLLAAKQMGATRAELTGYTDSGAVSGDTDQVVGYAGVIVS